MVCGCPCAPEMRVAPLPPPPTSQNDLSPAQCCVIHHVLEAPFEPFVAFWSAGHTRLRTARGGRPVCTLPNHARAVPTRPPARACVVPGRSGPMFRWTGVRKGEGRDGRGGEAGRSWSRPASPIPRRICWSRSHTFRSTRLPRRICPLSIRLVRTRRLEPLVSPFRAFRSAGCAWCTTRAGRSD